ncbi:putative endoplasmic reticulum membrane protein C16E8.02 [Bienertia sinuspersici]
MISCILKLLNEVVLASQLICWTAQFIGHGVFEKRAPALLDNLVQAFLMAPFFVLLEALHEFFGYEPYPGFYAKVKVMVDAEIKEWQEKKHKKSS